MKEEEKAKLKEMRNKLVLVMVGRPRAMAKILGKLRWSLIYVN
jgi:hypothetical protein